MHDHLSALTAPAALVDPGLATIGLGDEAGSDNDLPGARVARKDASTAKRILLVEDEFFIALEIERILVELGYQVSAIVPDLGGALSALAEGGFDAAVLDINLRGEEVYPVADKLQELGIPFLFATGYGDANIPPRYRDLPRLQKPFDARVLSDVMRNILASSP